VLASAPNLGLVHEYIKEWLRTYGGDYQLPPYSFLWEKYAVPTREIAEVRFIKNLLQHGLPSVARRTLVDALFRRYVSQDEEAFASELYMSYDQVKIMKECGKYIGCHGFSHQWFNAISDEDQVHEIDRSLNFMAAIGTSTVNLIMCYPYGQPDERLRGLLSDRGCALAFIDSGGIADIRTHDRHLLPRLDTIDVQV
jgi:hypothetical protein